MDRRTLLRRSALAGTAFLAGCMGSSPEQGSSMSVANIDFYGNDDGFLEVSVIVSNPGNDPEDGTLIVTARIDGDAQPRVREVSLDAHETREVTITYDTKMDEIENMDISATIEQA